MDAAAIIARATADGDCLLWPGATNGRYGQTRVAGKVQYVHRVVWEASHGPIPDGLTIDHLCFQRLCVNVGHLVVATRSANSVRRRNLQGDLCKRGHSMADAYVDKRGQRSCRLCHKAAMIRYRSKL